jgi:hypothetical protein
MAPMSLQSEMLLDAKLILRDGLAKTNPTAEIDAKGYVKDWRSNLLPEIDASLIEADLRVGKGNELDRKFLAAHSSCALAVNVFGPFRAGLGTFPMPGLGNLRLQQYERTFFAGVRGTPPHLDASALGPEGLVAIEVGVNIVVYILGAVRRRPPRAVFSASRRNRRFRQEGSW